MAERKKPNLDELGKAWREAHANGLSTIDLAERLNVRDRTLFRWRRDYEAKRGEKLPSLGLEKRAGRDSHNKPSELHGDAFDEAVRTRLLRGRHTLDELANQFNCSRGKVLDAIDSLQRMGVNIFESGEAYSVEKIPQPVEASEDRHVIESDENGYYKLGIISDTHYGSKYAREDVVEDLYDRFAKEGITTVYHAGNWIDGEARFNRFDLLPEAHGMQAQLDYFVSRYPQRQGMATYYVAGDDHEGWYSQREGVDIGRMLEQTAQNAGRIDLAYLGYIESYITLRHKKTRNGNKILIAHPGGGSAYAISYAAQKFVESLQGGEKPAAIVFGHWHKLYGPLNIRDVWCVGAGCTKDQDPFGRKKKIDYHVGGAILELWQDEKGSIVRCRCELIRYFDRGYYNYQWNPSGVPRPQNAPE